MRALLLALLLAPAARASSDMSQPGTGPGTAVSASTLTISGAGTACFTAGALSINCAAGSVTGSSGTFNDLRLTYGLTAGTGSFSGSVTASSVTTSGNARFEGNVGIGGAPSGKFKVYDSGSAYMAFSGGSLDVSDGTRTGALVAQAGSGEKVAGLSLNAANGHSLTMRSGTNTGDVAQAAYYDGSQYRSAWEFARPASGFSNLLLMKSGGSVGIGTASPCSTCTLHVAGGASVTGAFAVASATLTVAGGVLTVPSQPFISLHTPVMSNGVNTSAFGDVYWSIVSTNTAMGFDVVNSSNIVTVPVAGLYSVACKGYSSASTTSQQCRIAADGVVKDETSVDPVSASGSGCLVSKRLSLAAGAQLKCQVTQVGAGSLTTEEKYSWFEVYKLP